MEKAERGGNREGRDLLNYAKERFGERAGLGGKLRRSRGGKADREGRRTVRAPDMSPR